MESIKKKIVYFVDDNILGYGEGSEERGIRLFKGMIERKIRKIWVTQASVNIADKPEFLKYAYKAGCRFLFIGIESILSDTLKEMKKFNRQIGEDVYEWLDPLLAPARRNGVGGTGPDRVKVEIDAAKRELEMEDQKGIESA